MTRNKVIARACRDKAQCKSLDEIKLDPLWFCTCVSNSPEGIMSEQEDPLYQMDEVLNKLVATANSLAALAQEGCADEQIIPLQEEQETLVSKLIALDSSLQMNRGECEGQYDVRIARMQEKLAEFQSLNALFINEMRRHKSIIFFDSEDSWEDSAKKLKNVLERKR